MESTQYVPGAYDTQQASTVPADLAILIASADLQVLGATWDISELTPLPSSRTKLLSDFQATCNEFFVGVFKESATARVGPVRKSKHRRIARTRSLKL